VYALNAPTKYTDPSGHWPEWWDKLVLFFGGTNINSYDGPTGDANLDAMVAPNKTYQNAHATAITLEVVDRIVPDASVAHGGFSFQKGPITAGAGADYVYNRRSDEHSVFVGASVGIASGSTLGMESSVGAVWNAPDNNSLSGYTYTGQVGAKVLPAGSATFGVAQGASAAPGYPVPPTTISVGAAARGKTLPLIGQTGVTYSVEVWNSKKGWFPNVPSRMQFWEQTKQAANTVIKPHCSTCGIPD
jgi:hypothetical protein